MRERGRRRLGMEERRMHPKKKPHELEPNIPGTARDVTKLDWVPLRFIRFKMVRERTGLSRSTIWRLERTGAFPKHHRISPNAVAWVEQDVVDWMRTKANTA
jgi:prophage regulatory protein